MLRRKAWQEEWDKTDLCEGIASTAFHPKICLYCNIWRRGGRVASDIWKEKILNSCYYDCNSEFDTWAFSSRSTSLTSHRSENNSHRIAEDEILVLFFWWLQCNPKHFALAATWIFMATTASIWPTECFPPQQLYFQYTQGQVQPQL